MDLVRSTIDLGHAMGLRIVAEGIEDDATLQVLLSSAVTSPRGSASAGPSRPVSSLPSGSFPAVPAAPGNRADRAGFCRRPSRGPSLMAQLMARGSTTVIHPLGTLAAGKVPSIGAEWWQSRGRAIDTGRTRADFAGEVIRSLAQLSEDGPLGVSLSLPFGLSAAMKRHGLGLEDTIQRRARPPRPLLSVSDLDAATEPVPLRVPDPVLFVLNLAVYLDGLLGRSFEGARPFAGGSRRCHRGALGLELIHGPPVGCTGR